MASLGQVFELFSKLSTLIDWSKFDKEQFQQLIREAPRVAKGFEKFLMNGGQAGKPISCLISETEIIIIAPCNGSRFIGNQSSVFCYICDKFSEWNLNEQGESTEATAVSVHQVIEAASFKEIFDSLGASDLDKLCLSQDQIVEFCKTHSQWFGPVGNETHFLLKKNDHFYAVSVRVVSNGLYALVYQIDLGVWLDVSRHRIVTRQLTV